MKLITTWWKVVAITAVVLVAGGCATPLPDYKALVASEDRSTVDKANDVRRKPEMLLAFYGVRPGMTALDMGAGAGYNAELLARAVGPSGKVYAQNSPEFFDRMVPRFEERARNPLVKNIIHVSRRFEDPLPTDAGKVDLVTFNFFYHDTTYMAVDRARMNRAIYDALKPGGVLIIADHSARPGAGVSVGKSLHRIEEAVLRREVEAAGFKLAAEADFLRNPNDPRDAPVFKPNQPNDEFVLKYVKPK